MEQTVSRVDQEMLVHGMNIHYVYDGYTNKGEVLGSSIGPGSNSHYFSLKKLKKKKIGIAFEIIDNDNDFYHDAFAVQMILEDIGKILISY